MANDLTHLGKRTDALGERLAANEQLREAWARVDDHVEALRVASAALARAETSSDKVGLQARWKSQMDLLVSSFSVVETMTLRLAGMSAGSPAESSPRRVETLMASISSTLTAAEELQQGSHGIEGTEIRRLVDAIGDHLRRARLAFAELERAYGDRRSPVRRSAGM